MLDFINDCYDRVIGWNYKCFDKDFSDQRYKLQIDITLEEVKETLSAIKENDHTELLDGLSDIFVTLSFLIHMNENRNKIIYSRPVKFLFLNGLDNFYDVVDEIKDILETEPEMFDREYLEDFMLFFLHSKIGDDLQMYCSAVLDSNDSKIIKISKSEPDQYRNRLLDDFVNEANIKYKNKHENIVVVIVDEDDYSIYYVLRADEGKGKILKPHTFKEPCVVYSSLS